MKEASNGTYTLNTEITFNEFLSLFIQLLNIQLKMFALHISNRLRF